jgi:hypothetical protein
VGERQRRRKKMAGGSAALSEMELPPLPLEEWEDTKETLHRYCQIVGKIRAWSSLHTETTGGTSPCT